MPQRVIGIDLGGTQMRAGVVAEDGSIFSRANERTPRLKTASEISDAVAAVISDLAAGQSIDSIGLAIAAVTNPKQNKVLASPNLPQLADFDLAENLSEKTGFSVFLENDATAAAVGEHWLGAGRDFKHMICVTLGTGVGGGLILNGSPYYGADGNAGEIGHICLDADGPACGCGSNGCLEQYSSGTAIERIANELLDYFPGSPLHSLLVIRAENVFEAAIGGDPAAIATFENAGRRLGMALAGLVNLLNPEGIVITGGVSAAWDLFIGPTTQELTKRAFQQPAERVNIVRGTLGNDAGVLGAAKRAFSGKGF